MKYKVGLLVIFCSVQWLSAQNRGDIRLGAAYDAYNFRGIGPSVRYYMANEKAIQMDWMFNTFSDHLNLHANLIKHRDSKLNPKKMNQYMGMGVNVLYNAHFLALVNRPNGDWVKLAPYLTGVYGLDYYLPNHNWALNFEWRPKLLMFSPTLVKTGWPVISLMEISVGMRYKFPSGSLLK